MKKIFLFLAVSALAVSLNSCSKDDNNNGGGSAKNSIKFKFDGHQKTFTSITVLGQNQGEGQVYLTVEGTTSSGEMVAFGIYQGQTGANALGYFNYDTNTDDFATDGGQPFTSNVNANSTTDHKLKGTFSGSITTSGGLVLGVVTDGTFDITYPSSTAPAG